MKIWVLTIGLILIGVVAGASSAWLEFAGTTNQFEPHNQSVATALPPTDRIGPKVEVVDGIDFDFGVGQRQSGMNHTFVFRNEGDEPLRLTQGATTCKCTVSNLKSGDVAPGETAEVHLDWKLVTTGDQFRQTAEIHTNDPRRPTVTLTVHGVVTDLVRLDPHDVVLSDVSANEGATATVYAYGFGIKDLEIVSSEFENLETAPFFSLVWTPLTGDELGKNASVGLRGTLSVKPGLPLGPLNQTIHLHTNIADADKLDLEITGAVVSDISVVGPRTFSDSRNVLQFGTIPRAEGAKTTLRILVKGPHRQDVRLHVQEVDPADVLQASLGEAQQINDGAVFMYPLEVEIAPHARLVDRLGSEQTKLGRIVIGTTHPTAATVPIYVKFAVE